MKLLRFLSLTAMSATALVATTAGAGATGRPVPHVAPAPTSIYQSIQPATFNPGVRNANPYDWFTSISCTGVGDCTAVGSFFASDDTNQPMSQTSTNGVWAPVVPVILGSDLAGQGLNGSFSAVSCSSPGNCTAVGHLGSLAITETSTNNVWAPARQVTFDTNTARSTDGPNDYLLAVSCSSPGNCTAAGSFADGNFNVTPMTVTSTNGVWADVVPISWPDNFDVMGNSNFTWVSCSSAGNCTVAGTQDGWQSGAETYLSTSTNATWSPVHVIPHFILAGISCTAPGTCSAAGSILDAYRDHTAATVSSTNGVWGDISTVSIDPSLQYPGYPSSAFSAISCSSPGNCAAVGNYADVNWNYQPLLATSTNGVWSAVTLGTVASTPGNPSLTAAFYSVSCSSAMSCSAAGTSYDSQGNYEAITTTEYNGQWSPGVVSTFDPGVSAAPRNDFFTSISCSAPGTCTAAGGFTDVNNNYPPMTQSFRAPVPSAPLNVSATPAAGHVIVSWSAPAQLNGASISGYRVTVRRAGSGTIEKVSEVTGASTQAVVAIPARTFTVSVAALTSLGVGDSSEPLAATPAPAVGVRVPPAPRALTAVVANGSARLSWLPPVLSDGGSLIYQYIVTDGQGRGCVSGSDARFAATQFTCSVTGLTNGSRYSFSVTAVNIMGSSQPSPVAVVSPASPPTSAPMVSVDSLTAHRATLNVTAPRDMGGRALLGYEASFDNGRTWMSLHYFTSGNQIQLGALTPSNSYRVLIRARNQVGVSPSAVTTFTLPGR